MPTLHVMHGFIGAGKTTAALRLEQELGAVRLSNDDWMSALLGPNPPQQLFDSHYQAIDRLQWQLAERLLALGVNVLFDNGCWARSKRDEIRAHAHQLGVALKFHPILLPKEELWLRVAARNQNLPAGCLFIDRNAFDTLWQKFEPMAADEIT